MTMTTKGITGRAIVEEPEVNKSHETVDLIRRRGVRQVILRHAIISIRIGCGDA